MKKNHYGKKEGDKKNYSGSKPSGKSGFKSSRGKSSRSARPSGGEKREEGSKEFTNDKSGFKPRFGASRGKPFPPKRSAGRGEGERNEDGRKEFSKEKSRFNPNGNKAFKPKRTSENERSESGRPLKNAEGKREYASDRSSYKPRYKVSRKRHGTPDKPSHEELTGEIRLNRYVANAGICSRREADNFIRSGVVSVNGVTITEMGYKVKPGDIVRYEKESISPEKKVYIVMNKPRDYLTTTDDPQDRKHVMHLLRDAGKERLFPVGRLDRNTTGVLLFTNDGDLTKKLTHPKYGVKKIYHVSLDKSLSVADLHTISNGIELEDGYIKADEVSYAGDGEDKKEVGIQIHSGRNRIIRRLFEHLGYNVRKLDRVSFAGITKKDVTRGKWRFLTDKEVGFLNMIKQNKE